MRLRNFLIAVAVLAIAVPGFANAGSPNDRATGGGQILVSSDGGAGDTIAFTAQNTGGANNAAKGEVQYIDRTGDGTGRGQTRFHGDVTCLIVTGNTAELAGTFKNGTDATTGFILYVADNANGGPVADPAQDDQIVFTRTSDPTCERDDNDDDGQTALARGNAQVYDAQ